VDQPVRVVRLILGPGRGPYIGDGATASELTTTLGFRVELRQSPSAAVDAALGVIANTRERFGPGPFSTRIAPAKRLGMRQTDHSPVSTLGVKDIFDTADQPSEYGSPIYTGHRPRAVVAQLRAAEAVVLGKTVNAEFLWVSPDPTTIRTE